MRRHIFIGLLFIGLVILLLIPLVLFSRRGWYSFLERPVVDFPLALNWQTDLGRSSYEAPIYYKGMLLFPASTSQDPWLGQTHYWYGLDAATGQLVWSQQVNSNYTFYRCLTPEYLVVSGTEAVVALRLQTGEIIWEKNEGATIACSNELVFASVAPRDSIHALDISTGQRLWENTTPQRSFSSFIYSAETDELIASETTTPFDFYIIDPMSGELKRSFPKVTLAPLGVWQRGVVYHLSGGQLFLGGTVLDIQTGRVIHKEELYTPFGPTLSSGMMYLSTIEKGIVALDRENYTITWEYRPPPLSMFFQSVSPVPLTQIAVLNEVGYAIFSDATLRAFDLKTGQELGYWQPDQETLSNWSFACIRTPIYDDCFQSATVGLTAANDMLFISFGDGKLYALGQVNDGS